MDHFAGLIAAHNQGDREATAVLFDALYTELRQMARRQWPTSAGQTLSATCLVHEAYLKFQHARDSRLADRKHFFRLAKTVMRQVITDYARERKAGKRGGAWRPVTVEVEELAGADPDALVIDLDVALTELAASEPRLVDIVELKYFVGLNEVEIAEVLEVSVRTVQRDWRCAKDRLASLLQGP